MKLLLAVACIGCALVWGGVSAAQAPEKGAKEMALNGGRQGKVPFPHHAHQAVIADCNACHATFAQKAGAIDEMKGAGSLKPKLVMNTLCVKCHKEKHAAGEKTGPLTCAQCHVK